MLKIYARLLFIAFCSIFFVALNAQQQPGAPIDDIQARQLLAVGKDQYQQARYQDAINSFRDLLINPALVTVRGEAYFWVGKSLMALGRLEDAARNLDFFIATYKDNQNIPEASYQRGRILYLQSEYQNAIQSFARFLEQFPKSVYVPNAYYWTGEALYSMGQLDEAQKMFQLVLKEFPTSFRVEAARYRVALIDLRKREGQLLELLKWSHQENVKNLEDFQKREKVYDEAIRSYQNRMASLASADFKDEILILQQKADTATAQFETAQSRINELNTQLRTLGDQKLTLEKERNEAQSQLKTLQAQIQKPLSDALSELEKRQRVLDAKEQALVAKEEALKGGELVP